MISVLSLASFLTAIFGIATGHTSWLYLTGYVVLIVVPLINGVMFLTQKHHRYKHGSLYIITNAICWFTFVPVVGDLVFHY